MSVRKLSPRARAWLQGRPFSRPRQVGAFTFQGASLEEVWGDMVAAAARRTGVPPKGWGKPMKRALRAARKMWSGIRA